jgi:hypothetical protein
VVSRHKVIGWAVIAIVASVVITVWYGATIALERSHYVVLSHAAAEAVTDYIKQYRRWPSSWADLRRVPLKQFGPPYDDAYDTIEQKVHIDFSLPLEDVAAMDPATFGAIRNKGRPYADYLDEWRAVELIEAAREAIAARAPEVTAP